jgi:hypothetical protein
MMTLMEFPAGQSARRKAPSPIIPLVGYTIAIVCLIWVYQEFDWRSEIPKLLRTDWRWVLAAVITDVLIYIIQGWRWSTLLRPLSDVSVWRGIQAVYIGLFANEVLPLRSGEVVRTYLMRKWTGLRFSEVAASVIIERIMDGVVLVLGFYAATRAVSLPGYLQTGAWIIALVVMGMAVVVTISVVHKGHAKAAVRHSRWSRPLHHMVDAAHEMGNSRTFPVAMLGSVFFMGLQLGPVYCLMRGFGMDVTLGSALVVLAVLRLATAVPGLPGNLGTFQAATVLGVRLSGADAADAAGFATLLFVVVTVPLWAGGFIALLATRMRLHEIHRDAHQSLADRGMG